MTKKVYNSHKSNQHGSSNDLWSVKNYIKLSVYNSHKSDQHGSSNDLWSVNCIKLDKKTLLLLCDLQYLI